MSTNLQAAQKVTFTIGVQPFPDYSPYSSYQNGDYQGFNRELLDAFAEKNGYHFEYQALPLKRLYRSLLSGSIDAKYPDNPRWSQNLKEGHEVVYSEPVVSFVDGIVMLDQDHNNPREDLRNIGMISGFTPWPFLSDIQAKKINVFEAGDMDALIKMLLTKRIDGIYTNTAVIRLRLLKYPPNAPIMSLNRHLPFLSGTRHLSSTQHPELVVQFNQFLVDNTHYISLLKEKYGLSSPNDVP
ncbi:transporter substrate-binding domain-containing protein [Enterovibrio sp. ZSDZ42]|uniref:Transporter substrate-binding domain-containing protein n=1 Tax=Enterovibrio gelatinilyticus TaxID=2899819 RepID=A0ABT5R0B0_9GAMM|nr:transporter substrate-binding domain-containing protein [Enterovibrio sp. ZSDZ42]MDD1793712.1 transporter substrate-binding domain-containing protein [Enterovibrio sp. ZSDZ42]